MNTNNVSTGKPRIGGAVFRAPLGTPLPTSATEALDPAFLELGYVSDEGLKNKNSSETETVKDWGGNPVLSINKGKTDEFTAKLIESLNPNVLGTVYGDNNVEVDLEAGTIHVRASTDEMADQSYVFDVIMRGGALKRTVIAQASLGETGDIVYKNNEPVGYEITLKAMEVNGSTHEEYIQLPKGDKAAISLDNEALEIAIGQTSQLIAATNPAGGLVVWGSSDPAVAAVNPSGLITAKTEGSAVITANYGGLTAACTVTVTG